MAYAPLRIKAEDIEDITIFAAYLQDALTKMADITFQSNDRRFALMMSRFLWEEDCESLESEEEIKADVPSYCRVCTGIHFDNVVKVTSQNVNFNLTDHPLELLTIEAEVLENKNFLIDLIFAGEGVIRLEVELIDAYMKDIGDVWETRNLPEHAILHSEE